MASTMTGTVVAYFATEAQAEGAVSALKDAGFTSNQIGIARAGDTTTGSAGSNVSASAHEVGHKAGQAVGNAWDRIKNFFEGGSDEHATADRARTSADMEGSTYGNDYYHNDFPGTLGSMNVSDDHSRYFGHKLGSSETGAVVTVSATGRETEAESILTRAGGDVGEDAVGYDYGTAGSYGTQTSDYGTQTSDYGTGTARGTDLAEERRIQLLGEVLRVHKDRISRGEVRIRKEIISEQQTVQVPVTREELVIERIPVDGQVAAGTIGQDSEIRIPLSEEVASADKQTVVREEIAIGKRAVEGVQEVGGTVRREELEIEDETEANASRTPGLNKL